MGTGSGLSRALQLALPLDPTDFLPARLRALGLPRGTPVALHENTRVMVTFGSARGLRLHRGFAWAPDPVLAAIVRWSRPRQTAQERRLAARDFMWFPVHEFVPRPPRRRRPGHAAAPGDAARIDRLSLLHLELNQRWFGGRLGAIAIRLSGRMRRKLGHYEPRCEGPAAIVISRRHLMRDGWQPAAMTLLHEMVHQWQDEEGLPVDHGPAFRRMARAVGIEPKAVTRLIRPVSN